MNAFSYDEESDIEAFRDEAELEDVFYQEDDLQGLIDPEAQAAEGTGTRVPRYRSETGSRPSRCPIF